MKKVVTFGVFDYFHLGHLRLFEQARQYGDYLLVAVQEDEKILEYKPTSTIFYSTEDRVHLIESLRPVDSVTTYRDVDVDIQHLDFDVFAVGEDQNHEGFQRAIQWCHDHGKEVARLHYTKGISSTRIKQELK